MPESEMSLRYQVVPACQTKLTKLNKSALRGQKTLDENYFTEQPCESSKIGATLLQVLTSLVGSTSPTGPLYGISDSARGSSYVQAASLRLACLPCS
jgi:hypothetical protein